MSTLEGGWPGMNQPRGKPDFLRNDPESAPSRGRMNTPPWDGGAWRRQMEEAGLERAPVREVLSRRKFLIGAGATVAALAATEVKGKYTSLGKWLDDQIVGQFDYDEMVKEAKGFLKERYNIDLIMGADKDRNDILGDPVTLEKYRVSLRAIMQEMSKYPPEMIRKMGEGRGFEIRVVQKLRDVWTNRKGEKIVTPIGGIAPFLRQGKPADFIINADGGEDFQRSTIHHELNHRFTLHWEDQQARDKKWNGFHAKVPTSYREPRTDAAGKRLNAHEKPPERYFLREQAAWRPLEDQAICAEWMMTPRLHVEFVERWDKEKDPKVKEVLATKYNQTIADYEKWSNGERGRKFFDAIYQQGLKERALTKKVGR